MSDNSTIMNIADGLEFWAVIELTGKSKTAGRISRSIEFPGLTRIDVPDGSGGFYTEFLGPAAIWRIRPTSEEIARAYAPGNDLISEYDAPVVSREEHEQTMQSLRNTQYTLEQKVRELERRLTQVSALPAGSAGSGDWSTDMATSVDTDNVSGTIYDEIDF